MFLAAIFSFLMNSLNALAVDEQSLPNALQKEILPYITQQARLGEFYGVGRIKIGYYYIPAVQPQGVIVLVPGQSEPALKYSELLYDLKDSNYTIYVIDHRGQGISQRLLPDPEKSHVVRFSDYVDDLTTFINDIVKPQSYKKSLLLTHSMGGAVVAGYLQRFPNSFNAVVISSPMFEINTRPYTPAEATALAFSLNVIGRGNDYAPTQKPYDPSEPFLNNETTHSEGRFEMHKELLNLHPELRVGGATAHWVKESLKFTKTLVQSHNVFQVPTVILQAGQDQLVLPAGQNKLCSNSAPHCRVQIVPGARHEIFMEQDAIRNLALAVVKSFLN